ncbi:DUF7322 domain-containing protein [Halalkalicoccus ordinarius]|uniref:DUF7322 domain-containing protein n=1 Tax=Halalkalicoccus ordinarius TaxID=3116651 RepID=UPI00300E862F
MLPDELDERSKHEPDEPDLGPDVPDATSSGGLLGPEGTSKELLGTFWKLVLLFNVGLLAASLGAMLLVFEGRLRLGGGLLAAGLLALGRGVYRYRRIDPRSLGEDEDDNG